MVMQRYDPFQSAISLRAVMDRLMDESVVRGFDDQPIDRTLAINVSETDDAYTVTAALPGVKPEDVDITAHENVVTIRGEQREEEERQDVHYLIRERRARNFERTFTLPTAVDADDAEAKFENGMLKITIPKSEGAKPKKIKIKNLVPFLHR